MLFIVIISILVVHLSKCWPVNKYSLLVLLKNVPRVFLLVSKMINHLEAHTCLKRQRELYSYFVFQDRREVCFVTNVFPEYTDTPVARLQPEGVLRYQSVPPILPASIQ